MGRALLVVALLVLAVVALGPSSNPPHLQLSEDPYLIEELTLGPYLVRLEWPRNFPSPRDAPCYGKVLSVWRDGEKVAEADWVYELDPLTGTDLTGDGYPDVVVRHYSGGAHCCHETEVFSLGPTLERFPTGGGGECRGEFVDLDADGIPEFVTCDDLFAYVYCPFACSPLVTVVLRFEPAVGYVPASPEFPEVFAEDIGRHRELAESALGEESFDSWDGTPKCQVLPLVLDLLYSGRTAEAWKALAHYYRYPDLDAFRAEIEARVSQSPWYRAPER